MNKQTAKTTASNSPESGAVSMGTQIVVLDRGWVYVGKVIRTNDEVRIENARCIRRWETNNGLGQLRDGPLANTILDDCGIVITPMSAVIHFIKCNRDW